MEGLNCKVLQAEQFLGLLTEIQRHYSPLFFQLMGVSLACNMFLTQIWGTSIFYTSLNPLALLVATQLDVSGNNLPRKVCGTSSVLA